MYGIDKTLLVPLVQPSVDIVQGQVNAECLLLALVPASCSCLSPVSPAYAQCAELHCQQTLKHHKCSMASSPRLIASPDTVHTLQGRETAAEKRYRKLLLSGLELNKDFYFSYTYNLARTLQANLTADAPADPFDSMFVWNEYLSRYADLFSAVRKASICRNCMHATCNHP